MAFIIFSNNAVLNTVFAVPFIGLPMYGAMIISTATAGRILAEMLAGSSWESFFILSIYLSPHTYLEFLAYSITITESTLLGISIAKKEVSRNDLRFFLACITLSYAILFCATLVEAEALLTLGT